MDSKGKLSVVGQGYVGLPISIAAAQSGFEVFGIEVDLAKLEKLNSGQTICEDVSNDQIRDQIEAGRYQVTNDFEVIQLSEVVLICVPTPLTSDNKPDLSFLEKAAESLAKNLVKGSLVILESTVEPGTTRKTLMPILKKFSGLTDKDFDVAFSPERIDPMNSKWGLKNTPKIVSGFNERSLKRATEFYENFIDKVVECESIEVAETAKLLENSFRFVNISFINELSIFCQKMGIDVNDVISAASTKPYGFMTFYPSIGIGGHCIPVDPLYLSNIARRIGAPTRFIDLADQINHEMPEYYVGRAEEKVGNLRAKRILVVGVAYKPNIADVRETAVKALISGLISKGAQVSWHDDLVQEWNGETSSALSGNYDLAILATPHDYLDLTKLGNVPILNTRGSI